MFCEPPGTDYMPDRVVHALLQCEILGKLNVKIHFWGGTHKKNLCVSQCVEVRSVERLE